MRPTDRARGAVLAAAMLAAGSCGDASADSDGTCRPDDADGVVGGDVTFEVTVTDDGFSPAILAAQNLAVVTMAVHNGGAKLHDFVMDCMATPNDTGCPLTSCFPKEASIPAIAAGASASTSFTVPRPEGIYYYHSSIPGDAPATCTAGATGCGQFIVK
jgi:hypothetical protein